MKTAPSRVCWKCSAIPYSHSAVLALCTSPCRRIRDKGRDWRPRACRVPEGLVVERMEAAKAHPLPRPYVIKPISEGSSVKVLIVTEAHEHPPQESDPCRTGVWR